MELLRSCMPRGLAEFCVVWTKLSETQICAALNFREDARARATSEMYRRPKTRSRWESFTGWTDNLLNIRKKFCAMPTRKYRDMKRCFSVFRFTKRWVSLIDIRQTPFFLFDARQAHVIISTSANGQKGVARHWVKMGRPIIRSRENTVTICMDLG